MPLASLPRTLKRGVGRQILGYFLLAGILPVAVTAMLAYVEIERDLKVDVNRTLRLAAKAWGFDVLERLRYASGAAENMARALEKTGTRTLTEHAYLLEDFDSVWYVDAAGRTNILHGSRMAAAMPAGLPDNPKADRQLLFVHGASNDTDGTSGFPVFQIPVAANPLGAKTLFLALRSTRAWGEEETRPFATGFCAFAATGERIYCTQDMSTGLHSQAAAVGSVEAAPASIKFAGRTYLATTWQLFLAADFGVPPIDIVAFQPRDVALASGADFRRVFLPALALVVVLVGYLSLTLIGRSLVPLQLLTSAVEKIASGDLAARVRLRSSDEFGQLGAAFNKMARSIGRQISTLEVMSQIDRLILSGTKFEEVSEAVIRNLVQVTGYAAAGVIARDADAPNHAKLITASAGAFKHERISFPTLDGENWRQPRQIVLDEVSSVEAPYQRTLRACGLTNVVLIPVILGDELIGMLLIASDSEINMQQEQLLRCADLAGRFAVALSSFDREEALYRQAHFDELTGLPNRQLLKDRLEQHLAQARRERFSGAILFLDLDQFKRINDVHGHSTGDIVLKQAAERIAGEIRESDTLARLGGDEFVVIMPHVAGDAVVRTLAATLLEKLSQSFSVNGEEHFLGASMGIALFPDDGPSVETLLRNADAAMYRAKDAGRARFEFFSRKLNAESRRKIGLEQDLRLACRRNELYVYYQPQFDTETDVISGAEALLRWMHPVQGAVSPAEFIPLAEDSGLIVEIGSWVVEQTCRDLRQILDLGLHPGAVSINISARQLADPLFKSDVLEHLKRYRIHPGYMQLEVTETAVARNRDTAIAILEGLCDAGVRIAIDDFGTGYSSLSYLQQMPFDLLKIDKSFVDRIGAGDPSDSICRAIITMAHEMRKKSLAEGVETRAQLEFLKASGCDFVQGFYYSQALPAAEFTRFIEKQAFHTQRRKALESA